MLLVTLTISSSTMFRATLVDSLPLSLHLLLMPSVETATPPALALLAEISLRTLSGLMLRKLPKSKHALLKTVTLTALKRDRNGPLSSSSTVSSFFSSVSTCAASAAEPELPSAESVQVFAPAAYASSTSLPSS